MQNQSHLLHFRLGSIFLDLALILFLWISNITVYTIILMKDNLNPSNLDETSIDCTLDTLFFTIGILVQLMLRLYLRCVKNIKQSDGELISIKILIVHIFIYFLSYLFLFANWNWIDEVMMVLQYVVIPILILSYHPGFNQFYMSNHPNLRDTTNFIWHFLSIMYIKLCDFLLAIDIFRSNQIQPHNVII